MSTYPHTRDGDTAFVQVVIWIGTVWKLLYLIGDQTKFLHKPLNSFLHLTGHFREAQSTYLIPAKYVLNIMALLLEDK